jgi:hypothetical protein
MVGFWLEEDLGLECIQNVILRNESIVSMY